MKFVEVGGVKVSAVGLGTWQFGSGEWGYGSSYAEETAPAIVQRSLDLGVNLIDTAEAYAFGRSESIVGRALGTRRDEAFVATKLFPIMPIDPVVGRRARGSRRRLDIDIIDLYQVHWPNPVVPIGATMRALKKVKADGVVDHVGVSNFSLAKWQEAERTYGGPVLSNQVRYSLVDRAPESELLPWAQAHDRIVIAYSPLSQGLLSGRYDRDHLPGGLRAATPAFLPENVARFAPLLEVLREVAAAHDATCAQVALAWLIHQPNVVVIPGASSLAQAEANAEAADLVLSDAEFQALGSASEAYHPVGGLAAVPALARTRAERALGRVRRTSKAMKA
jgi:aryl-alcohol dehydrogenase-like predicted oxidoreductase